jgi:hypothetical protein
MFSIYLKTSNQNNFAITSLNKVQNQLDIQLRFLVGKKFVTLLKRNIYFCSISKMLKLY